MLILIAGLPGTGKSTLAKALAKRLDAVHLNSDVIRKEILEERTYSEEEKKLVYNKLLEQVEKEIKNGKTVIIDATFYKKELREEAIEIAKRNNEEYCIIKCILDEKIIKERIERRVSEESEADFEVYKKIKEQFEKIEENHSEINTSKEMEVQLDEAMHHLMVERFSKKYKLIQTHISWVFLTGEYVYKIKKPVNFSFLDFSTLEKRKFYCEEEIRLNKRLAPEIYLEVVPIAYNEGNFEFGKEGEEIEFALKLKELPQENKMDKLIKENKVTEEQIKEIAKIIVEFHSRIEVIKDKTYNSPEMLKEQIDDLAGVKETVEKACGMGEKIDFILEKCVKFIEENKELLRKRQEDGKIKECHGDLHTGNIFLLDKPIIFDCIEFSKDFRYGDTIGEVGFMAMDLDAQGKKEFSNIFIEEYIRLSKDSEVSKLLNLYKCYRANVRAKVAALGYMQSPSEENKKNIIKYLELAERYAKLLLT